MLRRYSGCASAAAHEMTGGKGDARQLGYLHRVRHDGGIGAGSAGQAGQRFAHRRQNHCRKRSRRLAAPRRPARSRLAAPPFSRHRTRSYCAQYTSPMRASSTVNTCCAPCACWQASAMASRVTTGTTGSLAPKGETLGDAARRAHAGKRAGAGAVGDRVAVGQGDAGFGQQFLHHRQDRLGMGTHARRRAGQHDIAAQQGARCEFGRSFKGKYGRHGAYFTLPRQRPACGTVRAAIMECLIAVIFAHSTLYPFSPLLPWSAP